MSEYLQASPTVLAARAHWRFRGEHRPDFAEPPGPGQRSVWDFPRPPRIERCAETLAVRHGSREIARSDRGLAVLETAGAPTYYFPPDDVDQDVVRAGTSESLCEWKGLARSIDLADLENVGWRYVRVFAEFAALESWVSFYPAKVACYVGEEQASPQPGGYYGGWVTRDLAGPIKGAPGSSGW